MIGEGIRKTIVIWGQSPDSMVGKMDTSEKLRAYTGIVILSCVLSQLLSGFAQAGTNYYISPSGSDTNSGLDSAHPWLTFAHAVPLLNAGDTLNLINGTYTFATNGKFFADCNATTNPAHNGTSTQLITIQAVSERQAWIDGDGSHDSFTVNNCSYWQIIGIHSSSANNNVGNTYTGYPFTFTNLNNSVVRRNIGDHDNIYGNVSAMAFVGSSNNVIEENEVYDFSRWGLLVSWSSDNNEVRRNYANARNYVATCPAGAYDCGGTLAIGPYNANNNSFENNIAEAVAGDTSGTVGLNVERSASNNTFLGNIAGPNLKYSFRIGPHAGEPQPVGNSYTDNVAIAPAFVGFWNRQGQATYNHDSAFGTSAITGGLFQFDSGGTTYSTYTHIVNNSTAQGATTSSNGAYFVQVLTGLTFSYDHDNCYNDAVCYNPNQNVTNPNSANPAFGACYLWVPDSSPLKRAASDGGDIGANILYQYVNGSLTSAPLWDPSTGAPLFKGATVAGLNDVAGQSLFDVAKRLNINQNGCLFPSGYGAAKSVPPAKPQGLVFK